MAGEQRGFALYVGMSESAARERGLELIDVIDALRRELIARVPLAESHALAVIAPSGPSPHDLDVVLRAFGEGTSAAQPTAGPSDSSGPVGVVIDLARHRVLVDGRDPHLTFKELALLQELVRREGGTRTREQLRGVIATSDVADVHDRTIDVHIRRLRMKFGAYPDLIQTVHGQGYRFDGRGDVTVKWSSTPSPDLI